MSTAKTKSIEIDEIDVDYLVRIHPLVIKSGTEPL
jgi:hypothetical protein